MRKTIRQLLTFLGVALVSVAPAFAAAITTPSTTLSAAIDNKQNFIQVASASGIVASSIAYTPAQTPGNGTALVVDGEVLNVIGVSGTSIQVQRGAFGTRSSYHSASETVYVINLQLGVTTSTQGLNPNAITGPLLQVPPSGECTVNNTYSVTFVLPAYGQSLSTWSCSSSLWTFGTFK